jgi:hypothetical protein
VFSLVRSSAFGALVGVTFRFSCAGATNLSCDFIGIFPRYLAMTYRIMDLFSDSSQLFGFVAQGCCCSVFYCARSWCEAAFVCRAARRATIAASVPTRPVPPPKVQFAAKCHDPAQICTDFPDRGSALFPSLCCNSNNPRQAAW